MSFMNADDCWDLASGPSEFFSAKAFDCDSANGTGQALQADRRHRPDLFRLPRFRITGNVLNLLSTAL